MSSVLRGVEELDVAGDDLELLAAAVVGVPLGVVQAAFDGDLAALGQVLGAGFGLAAEHGDVDVVSALVLAVLAGPLDGEAQAGDLGPPLVVRVRASAVSRPVSVTAFM